MIIDKPTTSTDNMTDSLNKRFVNDAQLTVLGNTSNTNSGNETATTIGSLINSATDKTTPVDADYLGLMDSAASSILKKLSWANIKATLKAYFDTIYLLNGWTTTATAAGTTTMDITYTPNQFWTGTTTQTVKLPTTSVVAGQTYTISNKGTSSACVVTVQSSGANTILPIGWGCAAVFTALQATPTTAAHWSFRKLNKNTITATSYTTDTGTSLNCDYYDNFIITAQAGALKLNNPTGTPIDNQLLFIAITGTAARALTYDTQFEASTVALPTTTVTTGCLNIILRYANERTKWIVLGAV